jgi:hypothetical protein
MKFRLSLAFAAVAMLLAAAVARADSGVQYYLSLGAGVSADRRAALAARVPGVQPGLRRPAAEARPRSL